VGLGGHIGSRGVEKPLAEKKRQEREAKGGENRGRCEKRVRRGGKAWRGGGASIKSHVKEANNKKKRRWLTSEMTAREAPRLPNCWSLKEEHREARSNEVWVRGNQKIYLLDKGNACQDARWKLTKIHWGRLDCRTGRVNVNITGHIPLEPRWLRLKSENSAGFYWPRWTEKGDNGREKQKILG